MNHLNSVLIEGIVVQKPLVTQSPAGESVGVFSLASNRYYSRHAVFEGFSPEAETRCDLDIAEAEAAGHEPEGYTKEVSHVSVEAWGKLSESCEKAAEGQGVRVLGRLRQKRWTDMAGERKECLVILAEHIELRPLAGAR
jgi:single-strand DNA-binding protein